MPTYPVPVDLPEPVPIPISIETPLLEDYAALLVRLTETQRALAEAESLCRDAEDRVWGMVVERIDPMLRPRAADVVESAGEAFLRLLAERNITTIDCTGRRLTDFVPGNVEVLCTRPTEDPTADGRIAETWRPWVCRDDRTILTGQVVVFRYAADAAEECGT